MRFEDRWSPSSRHGCAAHPLSVTPPPLLFLSPELPPSPPCLPGLFWLPWSAGAAFQITAADKSVFFLREEDGQALLHHTLVETILAESGQCQVQNIGPG